MADSSSAPRDQVDELLDAWARELPSLDVTSTSVFARLSRVLAATDPELDAALSDSGLSRTSFEVLAVLRRAGAPYELPLGTITAALRRTSGTMSVRMHRLERHGLVRRSPDPDDRRGVLVALTDRGRELFESAAPAYLERGRRLLEALDDSEREQLAGLLRKLLVSLEAELGDESVPAPRLGVAVMPSRMARRLRRAVGLPEQPGLLIRAVEDESPAEAAGLAQGDLITGASGHDVRTIRDLQRALRGADTVELRVVRGVEERDVSVKLAA